MHFPISKRLIHLLAVVLVAFCTLGGYLFNLQIAQSTLFSQLSRRNFFRQEQVESPRGNITDQYNKLLATNRPVYSLYWQGTGNYHLSTQQEAILTRLSLIFSLEPDVLIHIAQIERTGKQLLLSDDMPYEQLTKLVEQLPHNKNLLIHTTYERYYPHDTLASHIVGYLGMKDALGKMGLERLYNKKLTGQAGTIIKIINSLGRKLTTHKVTRPTMGTTIKTTLDLQLQQIAEKLFPKEYEGCLLLMDDDGALEVVLSRPCFSPGIFLQPLTHEQWRLLQQNNGFINRAFSACYPPASLFKLVTLAAALETSMITPDTEWRCKGALNFKGRNYHCNRRWGHGIINTKKAFAQSCNVPFYDIGTKMPIDTLAEYAHALGLGVKTGIFFPEQKGLVPTSSWKQKARNEPWWPGETLSAVIGQSSLLVTPLQLACMICAVGTGSKVRPRMLVEEPVIKELVQLRPATLSFLQQCLTSVIKKGTGTLLNRLSGFTIQGKSGTAQVRSCTNKTSSKKDLPHGYFAARFQYKHYKPRTLVILLEHANTSRHAISLAHRLLEQIARIEDQRHP